MSNAMYLPKLVIASGVTLATCAGLFFGSPYFTRILSRQPVMQAGKLGHPAYRWFAAVSIISFCVLGSYVLAAAFTALTSIPIPWFLASMALAGGFRKTTEMTVEEFPDREAAVVAVGGLIVTMVGLIA